MKKNLKKTKAPEKSEESEEIKNKGQLIVDASCAPADIRYPTDMSLLNEGRFGVAKRRYGLGLIKSKLKETSETDINVSILVLNLDKICAKKLTEIRQKYRIKLKKAS